jgi:DNA-binding MarR family transcriptional regulator
MAEGTKAKNADVEKLRVNEAKWSKPLMQAGWIAFPNIIIERQAALGLDPVEVNIILHLAQYWWTSENLPHPSIETIAKALGMKPRGIQKRIARLVADGFIEREERRYTKHGSDTNRYSFKGLIEKARPFAEEKIKEIEERAEKQQARLRRRRPRLELVK